MLNKMRSIAAWFAGIEIWIILLLVGLSLVWSALLWAAVIVGILFWFLRWIGVGRFTVRTPADLGIACLVIISLFSIVITQSWREDISQYLRLFTGVVLYYAIVNWIDPRKRESVLITGIILVALGLCVFAVIGVEWAVEKFPFFPPTLYEYFLRLVSDTANPNVIAGSLVIFLPILFAVLLFPQRKEKESDNKSTRYLGWLAGIALLGTCLVLGLSQSRGAWIAGNLSILLVISLRWKWGWLVFLLAGLAIWAVDSIFGQETLIEILLSTRTLASLDERFLLWTRAIQISKIFSYTGIGMGSFSSIADLLFPSALNQAGSSTHAHNLFLQIAVDLGLPGLIAWSSIWISLTVISWKLYIRGRKIKNSWIAALGAGLLGSQLALAVHGMLDVVAWGMVRPAPIVWAIWGVIALLGVFTLGPVITREIDKDIAVGIPGNGVFSNQ